MELKFWGVRGSIPTPSPENLGFGGNTTCLELRLANGEVVLIDGGTGARKLGLDLIQRAEGKSIDIDILMTASDQHLATILGRETVGQLREPLRGPGLKPVPSARLYYDYRLRPLNAELTQEVIRIVLLFRRERQIGVRDAGLDTYGLEGSQIPINPMPRGRSRLNHL